MRKTASVTLFLVIYFSLAIYLAHDLYQAKKELLWMERRAETAELGLHLTKRHAGRIIARMRVELAKQNQQKSPTSK